MVAITRKRAFAVAMMSLLLIGAPAQETGSYTATVRVGSTVLNVVRPEIFGDNLEWTNNGMGLWDSAKKAFDPRLLELARESGVTHLRSPGGPLSDYFHWQWATGTARKPIPNPFDKGTPTFPEFGPDEFMKLCKTLGIRATITLNAGTGTAEEAAAWVRYNAEQRFPVIDYEVGNEVYMRGDAAVTPNIDKTPQQYIDFFLECERAIHKDAPGAKIGAIGLVDTGTTPLCKDPLWTEKILTALGGKIDFLAIHNSYAPIIRASGFAPDSPRVSDDDFAVAMLSAPVFIRDNIKATKDLIARGCPDKGKKVDIHITESGPLVYPLGDSNAAKDLTWNRSLAAALYQAGLFNVLVSDPKVTSVNHLPFCQDIFGALIGVHVNGIELQKWRNTVFHVFRLYSAQRNRDVLATNVNSPTRSVPSAGFLPKLEAVPLLDACTFRDRDKRLFVMLINRDVKRGASVTLDPNLARFEIANITTLSSASYKDANLPDKPDAVKPVVTEGTKGLRNKTAMLLLPKCSLTCVEIVAK